jgi:hypothetical protein
MCCYESSLARMNMGFIQINVDSTQETLKNPQGDTSHGTDSRLVKTSLPNFLRAKQSCCFLYNISYTLEHLAAQSISDGRVTTAEGG